MSSTLFRLYLAIASLVGLFGAVIGYGIVGYTTIERAIISDDEYLYGGRSYEMTSCEQQMAPIGPDGIQKNLSPEEIEKCKSSAKSRIIMERAYSSKTSMIGGITWGTIFLIVFLGHFPVFYRSYRREQNQK